MATVLPQSTGFAKRKTHLLRIDMTPMVDLGFLLITFFIFTATLSQPGITKLIMPNEGEDMPVPESKTLTILLDNEKAFAYEGLWTNALAGNRIIATGYDLENGMGATIRQKQKKLAAKDDLIVLIKPLSSASYQNILTALDEMQINRVQKYAMVEASKEEKAFVLHR